MAVTVAETLDRLAKQADTVRRGWVPPRWTKLSGPGPDEYTTRELHVLQPLGTFDPVAALEPGVPLTLSCPLDPPDELAGVPLRGDALELTWWGLFPIDLTVNGVRLLEEDLPPIALGPALVPLLDEIGGPDDALEVRIRPPANQLYATWNWFAFTTPGLRRRFELIDVAWAQLFLADALAASSEERKAVEAAALLVPEDLATSDEPSLERDLVAMADALAPLSDRVAELDVHVVGHTHIDMNWLWTWPETQEVVKRDITNVLQLLDDYPEMRFTHSQPATYDVIRRQRPDQFETIRGHVEQGRWEPATCQWVEGDTNLASGEAMARQLLAGVGFTREHLGTSPEVFLAPDTFGHAANLPQLAVSAGARVYYHGRCNPGLRGDDIWPAYWWEGQDGTRLLAVTTKWYSGHVTAGDVARTAVDLGVRHGHRTAAMFCGVGDHGGGPTRQSLDTLRRLGETPLLPRARWSTLGAFASDLEQSGVQLPTHRGESSTTFEGCYTTHADAKRYNRHGENVLCTADTLAALAGVDRRPELADAWRKVCFNQFHDILDGAAIRETYVGHAADFDATVATAASVVDDALLLLQDGVAAGSIAVTNPSAWDRDDLVEIRGLSPEGPVRVVGDHGHVTPGQRTAHGMAFVAQVPAFATVAYRVEVGSDDEARLTVAPAAADAPFVRVDTPHFRASVRRDSGIICGLFDKRIDRQLAVTAGHPHLADGRLDLGLNVLQLIDEKPHDMSAWMYGGVHTETSILGHAKTEVVEVGPVRVVIGARHQVRSSDVTQQIVFYADLARIDVHTTVHWREPAGADHGITDLKVAFTPDLPECEAWFETPFGAVRRRSDGREVPALRWADVGGEEQGFSLLNESKYGHDALGNRLRLTLLRNAYEPDEASDLGHHEFSYSLVPHAGDWRAARIPQQAIGFNQPLLARVVDPPSRVVVAGVTGWVPDVSGDGSVVVACVKLADRDRGRVIRLYESTGRGSRAQLAVPAGATVWEASIVEDRLAVVPVVDGRADLAFRPWQVRTVVVDLAAPEDDGG